MEKIWSNSIEVVENFSEWKTNGQTQLMWLKTFQNGKQKVKLNGCG